ncbi:chalcone isomerase domain-containing protein [Aspergillus undulatus]|uniref:chalcone isomerase domain-containing protein n=1 Tax=Aspergillus undulatus TaxID=1810928 RepID=UPI003CCDBE55
MAMKPLSMQSTLPFRNGGQCLRNRCLRPSATTRYLSTSSPHRSTATNSSNPLRSRAKSRAQNQDVDKARRSMIMSAAGIAGCAVAMYGVIKLDVFGLEQQQQQQQQQKSREDGEKKSISAMRMDGPDGFPHSPSVIRIQGKDGAEQIATGTSSVPHFPSVIQLPKYQGDGDVPPAKLAPGDEITAPAGMEEEEYQLLGLGIRTVSFLRIQVYVVGLYVATSDISKFQQRLVQMAVHPPTDEQVIANPVGANSATSLVSTERGRLKDLLLDDEKGDDAWNAILKDDGIKTVFRIVPTRNTDFLHLRDGWVRGITARAQKFNAAAKAKATAAVAAETPSTSVTPSEFADDSFGTALNDFKSLFGGGQRKSVPKGQTLLLLRNARGELDALFQPKEQEPFRFMGRVEDERIGRLVWLNYLAGKNVSSDEARRSVVDGVMGIVERPIGTVVQKIL